MTNEYKWFVLRAISGKEKKAKEYIDTEIDRLGIRNIVRQVLIPMEKVFQVRNGKKIVKERNFFPGYILVEAVENADMFDALKTVPNVVGWLAEPDKDGKRKGLPDKIVSLREYEVNKILGKVDEISTAGETIGTPYSVGESVKVTDGPFNDFTGVVEEVYEDKKKLKVMVKIFGRRTPLELNYVQVEKI